MRATRAALLAALLVGGCTAGSGVVTSPATPSAAPATQTASPEPTPTPTPSAPPSASPVLSTVYTADDTEIAKLIKAGVEEATPQLKGLADMDPGQMEVLFLPLGMWITEQREGLNAYTPTSCTAGAVALFSDGLDQYDAIRQKFMEWQDWGANGRAYPPGAPREARENVRSGRSRARGELPKLSEWPARRDSNPRPTRAKSVLPTLSHLLEGSIRTASATRQARPGSQRWAAPIRHLPEGFETPDLLIVG
jgi:hypothetical protein